MKKIYHFAKAKTLLKTTHFRYQKKKKSLSAEQQKQCETLLKNLQTAIHNKDLNATQDFAKQCKQLSSSFLKKTASEHLIEGFFALLFALAIAIVVRQTAFEFYTIPTGSMRPTFKEQDYLVVSKTNFGINTLTRTSHFYFNPHLVQRGNIVIFSSENLDLPDTDTLYFYLIPGKKQFIKRLIGKPGDTLYFYGGHIYGLDAEDRIIEAFQKESCFQDIEHIPFLRLEGKLSLPSSPTYGTYPLVMIKQMNQPLAKLFLSLSGKPSSEILCSPETLKSSKYFDLWGIKNFATAQILKKDDLSLVTNEKLSPKDKSAGFYLELRHHPDFSSPKIIQDDFGRVRPSISYSSTLIPLDDTHLKKIFQNLYTCRFVVKNHKVSRLGWPEHHTQYLPSLNVPDGTYEFYDGKAYSILTLGIPKELEKNHPIYAYSPENAYLLFNLGMEFDTRYLSHKKDQTLVPSRYAYFREGSLYLMGKEIFQKNEPVLINFLQHEHQKGSSYLAFEDFGSPLKPNGDLDKDLIKKFGLRIPPKMYLVLGDNHAMSADSREFGFVPEANLRGGASFIFWPANRMGQPLQPSYPWLTWPRAIVWGSFIVAFGLYRFLRSKKNPL